MAEQREEILEELQQVEYVGPAVSEQLYEELSVREIEDIVEAAENGWLRRIDGIPASREEDIGVSARSILEEDSGDTSRDATEGEGDVSVKTVGRETAGRDRPPPDAPVESDEAEVDDEEHGNSGQPRPRVDRFLKRLRCPACGHDQFERGDGTLTCTACRREYDRRGGITDLAPPDLRPGGLAQRVMESELYTKVYEKYARPWLTSLVSDRSLADEKALAAEYLELDQDSVVLDIACGTGNFTRYIAEEIAASAVTYDGGSLVVGLDVSRPMLERARGYLRRDGLNDRVFLVRGDATRMPVGRATFNRLHCSSAIHLMEDIDEVLRNFARALEPNGICVVSTYLARGSLPWRLTKRIAEIPTEFHWFEREELHERLERAGLEVVEDDISRQAVTVKARRK
jgi:ubiquinone/menaquinone biosynthesis C-methylase UbiE/uncharacterized protein YbaR (Trm112 family)